MKDVNKILGKAHFKCQKKINVKKQIFVETCLYDLPITSSCSLREKSSLSIISKCSEPWNSILISKLLLLIYFHDILAVEQ
jgi:hypothetical protein